MPVKDIMPRNIKPDREWLLTNELGGYSFQTAARVNSRRFHSLFTESRNLTRYNILNSVEISNAGTESLDDARDKLRRRSQKAELLGVFPSVRYRISGEGFSITEEIALSPSDNAVELCYRAEGPVEGQGGAAVEIRPFFSMRQSGFLRDNVDDIIYEPFPGGGRIKSAESVCYFKGAGEFTEETEIKNEFYYEDEIRDGACREKLFSPGKWKAVIGKGAGFKIIFAASRKVLEEALHGKGNFSLKRRRAADKFLKGFRYDNQFFEKLLLNSLSFDASGEIVAGFPWFEAWGRDTMISLPGIFLCAGRREKAKKIFRKAAASLKKGLLPNIFSTRVNNACYNSVDASLWFIWALSQYRRFFGNDRFLKEMAKPVGEIIKNYKKGTDFGIKMDPADGLINAGQKGKALTWMDAVFEGRPITPREGKPVEIQGLWYNALRFSADCGDGSAASLLARVAESVKEKYFLKEGFMADLLNEDGRPDANLRPNQIITLALMRDVLPSSLISKALKIIDKKLITPFGPRTLARGLRAYRGIYLGNLEKRDSAYHQGTVWPWLLQFYYALRKPRRADFEKIWSGHFKNEGIDCVSEIFDAEYPFYGRGCVNQAWSEAALLYVSFEQGWIRKKQR